MKNWKGTTGEWLVTKAEEDSSGRAVYRVSTYIRPTKEQFKANSELIEDAAQTVNKCDLMPSELLKQRDELFTMVQRLKSICEGEILEFNIPELNELIKQIEG